MKNTLRNTMFACLTTAAMAGTQETVIAPAPAPTLGGWFVGGSYGQINDADNLLSDVGGLIGLLGSIGYGGIGGITPPPGSDELLENVKIGDLDFDLYTLQVGRKLNDTFLTCDTSVFLELGYLDGSMSVSSYSQDLMGAVGVGLDIEIIPITANVMLERQIFGNLNAYATAGIGFAFTEASLKGMGESMSSDDIEFYAQASLGLSYDVTQNWAVFGGVRWLYLNNMEFGSNLPLNLIDDQIAWELGVRYSF